MRRLANIYWLGLKELRSVAHDLVLLGFVIYSFTFAVYSHATGISHELRNASIAVADEDRSDLSGRIAQAFLPPYFKTPAQIAFGDVDRAMDRGLYTFVVVIPPAFEADVRAGRGTSLQVNVDATAMMQAGIGAGYIQRIVTSEIERLRYGPRRRRRPAVALQMRVAFNPNLETPWFAGVMALLNNITMLAIILAGAAVVREREHGAMDHLLAMPLSPLEIALAKIWSNGLVIAVVTFLSLWLVMHVILGLPLAGSVTLFMTGVVLYLFFATAVGISITTVARSMPQLGLLFILIVLPMTLLSGSNTPLEKMPEALQVAMSAVPSTHFVKIAQAVLYPRRRARYRSGRTSGRGQRRGLVSCDRRAAVRAASQTAR